jgi:hypothetical protein
VRGEREGCLSAWGAKRISGSGDSNLQYYQGRYVTVVGIGSKVGVKVGTEGDLTGIVIIRCDEPRMRARMTK